MVQGKGTVILIVAVVFLAISLTTVFLRCVVRLWIVKAFGWDDGLMLLAMALNLGFSLCGIIGTAYGVGQKNDYFEGNLGAFRTAMLCWWWGELLYVTTAVTVKFSIIITLLRIVFERIHKWVLYIAAADHGRRDMCADTHVVIGVVYAFSAGEALTDLTIGITPWFVIRRLNTDRRERIALAGILGIGSIASAAVIIRFPFVHHWESPDLLYAISEVWIWSNVESGLGITAGSLVTLWPLFSKLCDRRSTQHSSESQPYGLSDLPPLHSSRWHGENLDYHFFLQEEVRHRCDSFVSIPI